jgi:hypothetical protein
VGMRTGLIDDRRDAAGRLRARLPRTTRSISTLDAPSLSRDGTTPRRIVWRLWRFAPGDGARRCRTRVRSIRGFRWGASPLQR